MKKGLAIRSEAFSSHDLDECYRDISTVGGLSWRISYFTFGWSSSAPSAKEPSAFANVAAKTTHRTRTRTANQQSKSSP
jgi:hypothetical protein